MPQINSPTPDATTTTKGKLQLSGVLAGTAAAPAFSTTVGAWVSYTPTWTASTTNPAIGNGTITGFYTQIGKTVTAVIEVVAGSTTTFGSGRYSFSLPSGLPTTSKRFLGSGAALRTGAAFYSGPAFNGDFNYAITTTLVAIMQPTGVIQSTTAAWSTGDIFNLEIIYETA